MVAAALAADVAGVTAFVVAGRRTHADGDGGLLDGVAGTAWPFLVALGVGWLLARAWRRPLALRCGAVLWLSTVVLGLVLRGAAGGGLAPAFVAVTAAVLGLVLVGWRALAALLRRGTTDPG